MSDSSRLHFKLRDSFSGCILNRGTVHPWCTLNGGIVPPCSISKAVIVPPFNHFVNVCSQHRSILKLKIQTREYFTKKFS